MHRTSSAPLGSVIDPSRAEAPARRHVPVGTRAEPASPLVAQLDREWRRLHTSPRALAAVRTWVRPGSAHPLDLLAATAGDLDAIVAAAQRQPMGGNGDDDRILARLVELSRHDDLAGRIVVQRLLPGLVVQARRYHVADTSDPLSIAIPAAWLAIRAYDTDQRPRHVAASLLSDAIYQGFRKALRRRSVNEIPTPAATLDAVAWVEPPVPALVELAETVREAAAAGVPGDDLDLIRALVRAGSPSIVAADRKVTTRTVRNHRNRAVHHIRRAVAA